MRVLLTAYADTDAAIAAINDVGVHHYLMKPWDPPEQRLYPVLDDLLAEWSARVRLAVRGHPHRRVALVAAELRRARVPVAESGAVPVDRSRQDAPTRALVQSLAGDPPQLPVVLFPDGTHLVAPTTTELATKAGLQTARDAAVLRRRDHRRRPGGARERGLRRVGRAADAARRAVARRAGRRAPARSSRTTSGFRRASPARTSRNAPTAQARRFGAELLVGQPSTSVRREDPYRIVQLADGTRDLVPRARHRDGHVGAHARGRRARRAHRRRRLLRRRDERGGALPRPGRRRSSAARTRRGRARCSSRATARR